MATGEQNLQNLNTIRDRAISIALDPRESGNLDKLAAAASICKLVSDVQKESLDIAQTRRTIRSDNVKFWVPVVGSFISVFVLAGTLIFQVTQFQTTVLQQNKTLQAQIDAAEDTQWRESIKIMADKPTLVNTAAGFATLNYFLQPGRHAKEARSLAVQLLENMTNKEVFNQLFSAVMAAEQTHPESQGRSTNGAQDLGDVIRVNRGLKAQNVRLSNEKQGFKDAKQSGQKLVPFPASDGSQSMVDVDEALGRVNWLIYQVQEEQKITTRELGKILRNRRNNSALDLTDTMLLGGDLSKANLSGANLTYAQFACVNVDDADFSNTTASQLGTWDGTPWWRVASMGSEMLRMLAETYPFRSQAPDCDIVVSLGSKQDYLKHLARLTGKR